MSRKVLRPPSTVERKGVDNASLVANGSVKELGLRVVNHLANYSLPPSLPLPSFLHSTNRTVYINIYPARGSSKVALSFFPRFPKNSLLQRFSFPLFLFFPFLEKIKPAECEEFVSTISVLNGYRF